MAAPALGAFAALRKWITRTQPTPSIALPIHTGSNAGQPSPHSESAARIDSAEVRKSRSSKCPKTGRAAAMNAHRLAATMLPTVLAAGNPSSRATALPVHSSISRRPAVDDPEPLPFDGIRDLACAQPSGARITSSRTNVVSVTVPNKRCSHQDPRSQLEAMGGQLEVVARFPDGVAKIADVADLEGNTAA